MMSDVKKVGLVKKIDYRPLVAGKPVLVIVDMQPRFQASHDPAVLAGVAEAIRGAKARQEPIVVLEFAIKGMIPPVYSPTHKSLTDILEDPADPAFWSLKFKFTVGGAREVLIACKDFGFADTHFRVCGVNTSQCVYETALGLANKRPGCRVEVLSAAVNDKDDNGDPWLPYENVRSLIQVV